MYRSTRTLLVIASLSATGLAHAAKVSETVVVDAAPMPSGRSSATSTVCRMAPGRRQGADHQGQQQHPRCGARHHHQDNAEAGGNAARLQRQRATA